MQGRLEMVNLDKILGVQTVPQLRCRCATEGTKTEQDLGCAIAILCILARGDGPAQRSGRYAPPFGIESSENLFDTYFNFCGPFKAPGSLIPTLATPSLKGIGHMRLFIIWYKLV